MKFLEFYDSTFRSVTLVTGCSILVSSNQLFGDPIQCDLVKEFFFREIKILLENCKDISCNNFTKKTILYHKNQF